jgi:GxxExxY protein
MKHARILMAGLVHSPACMIPQPVHIKQVTETIIGCAIEVHKTLGAGLLESVYKECMIIELAHAQLCVGHERNIKLTYKGVAINSRLRLDLIVEGIVVVELKAIECVHPIHLSQVITYLKLADCPAGLLLNFNVTSMRNGVRRLDHPDLYTRKSKETEQISS